MFVFFIRNLFFVKKDAEIKDPYLLMHGVCLVIQGARIV